jgi:hypothetical protein
MRSALGERTRSLLHNLYVCIIESSDNARISSSTTRACRRSWPNDDASNMLCIPERARPRTMTLSANRSGSRLESSHTAHGSSLHNVGSWVDCGGGNRHGGVAKVGSFPGSLAVRLFLGSSVALILHLPSTTRSHIRVPNIVWKERMPPSSPWWSFPLQPVQVAAKIPTLEI